MAMNAADQYIQSGFESAMSRQANAEKMDDMPTKYDAGVFFTRYPVATFVRKPQTTVGMSRREV